MTRTRSFSTPVQLGIEYQDGLSGYPKSWDAAIETVAEQLIWTEGHYGYPHLPSDRNVGGDFWVAWNKLTHTPSEKRSFYYGVQGGAAHQHYEGKLITSLGNPYGTWINTPANSPTASPYATALFNKMKPTKPNFQGLNSLYELRELPEQLRQRFLKDGFRSIGNYWLALQFGWKPLLNDCRNLVLTQFKAQQVLKQLIRDNGKPVRRKIILYDNTVELNRTEDRLNPAFYPGLVTQYHNDNPLRRRIERNQDKVWAAARYRYFLPPGPQDIRWRRTMMAKIFGLEPSPQVVWNAMPWTWLSDWFINIGQVLANMDAGVADRLAAEYFYVMRMQRQWTSLDVTGVFHDYDSQPFTVSATSVADIGYKSRIRGDPFGWNTPENNLSGMQLSILGALGLSRLR